MLCGVWSNKRGDPVVAQNKQKEGVVLKMFFVMGLSWIVEVLAIFWDTKIHYKEDFVFQLFNDLQGFLMFCVIYFDSSRRAKIKERIQEILKR